jgi:hypothetical protein
LLLHFKGVIAVFKPLLTLVSVEECLREFFDVSKMIFFISPERKIDFEDEELVKGEK